MDIEQEMANGIYVFLKSKNGLYKDYVSKSIIAENIGKLLMTAEARGRVSFSKTLLKLNDKYLQEIKAEIEEQIVDNKTTIYGVDPEHLGC